MGLRNILKKLFGVSDKSKKSFELNNNVKGNEGIGYPYKQNDICLEKPMDGSKLETPQIEDDEKQINTVFVAEPKTVKREEVIIGFDFGSSCTKVIVNFPTFERKFAIDFKSLGHKSNSFLLPTIMYINQTGCLTLEKENNSIPIKDFKIELLDNSEKICHDKYKIRYIDVAIAYIGSVLNLVKKIIVEKDDIPSKNIVWKFNLGIPSASHNDEKLRNIFTELAYSAWLISENFTDLYTNTIRNAQKKENWEQFKSCHIDNINVVSEIGAEVVGFAKSKQRLDGLYVLIDIGSRTIDISSFHLFHSNGDDKYAFLTAEVNNFGTFYLHEQRMNKINSIAERKNKIPKSDFHIIDSISPIPDYSKYFEENDTSIDKDEIELLNEYFNSCKCFLLKTFGDLRNRRDPGANEWENGLPVFICGGGKNIPFYNHVIDFVEDEYINTQINTQLIRKTLSAPANIGYNESDHDRMAVAYGLSFGIFDIGVILPPSNFADIYRLRENPNDINEAEDDIPNLMDSDYYY